MSDFRFGDTRWAGALGEQRGISAWVETGLSQPALAWVDYEEPVVIYGRRGGLTPERQARAAERGCALLARRSGGGAVIAGPWMLGLHLWLPKAHPAAALSAAQAMVAVGAPLARVLREQGAVVRMAHAADMARNQARISALALDWNCYAGLSHGELLDGHGRKCLGLAQARTGAGVLISAGLLVGTTPCETLDYVHLGRGAGASTARELISAGLDLAPGPQRKALEHRIGAALRAGVHAEAFAPTDAHPRVRETTQDMEA